MALKDSDEEKYFEFKSEITRVFSDVLHKYNSTKEDLISVIDWLDAHGFFEEESELTESVEKIEEMGMRKYDPSFDTKTLNNLIAKLNSELEANFGKKGFADKIEVEDVPGVQDKCKISFVKPLRDFSGKSFAKEAQAYLRGAKIMISKVNAEPEILSAISSIQKCIDYDNAEMLDDKTLELTNPEMTSYDAQLVAPSGNSKIKVAYEEPFYAIFSDTGYGPSVRGLLEKYKTNVLKDCYKILKTGEGHIHRGSSYTVYKTREEASDAVRVKRDDEAYSSQFSRGYYRTCYKVGKCNSKGEIILSTSDFYNPDLWGKEFPSDNEIKECIKIYNASIEDGKREEE